MNYYSSKEFPQAFHVLPYDDMHLADEALARIRAAESMRHELVRAMDTLRPYTVLKMRSELAVGRRYGVFGISPFANAWRDGKLVERHGEVYIHVWTFQEDGTFTNANAWGGVSFDAYPCKGAADGILVEL